MVDADLLAERYEKESFNAIVQSLRFLHQMGVFELFANANKQLLVDGFDSGTVEELAKKIHEVQQTNRVYLILHEMAGSIQERK